MIVLQLITPSGTCFPIKQQGRLYYLYKNSVNDVRSETIEMWHKILGHCIIANVKKIRGVSSGNDDFPNMIINSSKFNCGIYILAKQVNVKNKKPDI